MTRFADLERVFALIAERLRSGRAAPTDGEIASLIGFWSIEQARVAVAALADAGRITISGFGPDRTIALRDVPTSPSAVAVHDPVLEAGTARILAALRRGRPAPIAAPPIPESTTGETDVPNPPPSDDFRAITFPARGEVLRAINVRASNSNLSLNKAAISLIEDALAQPVEVRPMALNDLPGADLLGELSRRLDHGSLVAERDAAIARAEAAEGQLATLRQQITGLIAG